MEIPPSQIYLASFQMVKCLCIDPKIKKKKDTDSSDEIYNGLDLCKAFLELSEKTFQSP